MTEIELGISPAGELRLWGSAPGFADGLPAGLLAQMGTKAKSPSLKYWCEFLGLVVKEYCHIPELLRQGIEISLPQFEPWLERAPPMRGAEYLSEEVLAGVWQELSKFVFAQIEASKSFEAWLREHFPGWHKAGRVCFHLAERKSQGGEPFAFLATYSAQSPSGALVQRPLSQALSEYSGSRSKKKLLNLLLPVERAAQQLPWLRALIESKDLFHALAWSAQEAWGLLRDSEILESSGVQVKVPDWRRSRASVQVSVGEESPSRLGVAAMLDINVDLVVDGEPVTEEEQQAILAASEGLLYLKGRWVEVNSEALRPVLDHWQSVRNQIEREGLSFTQSMRLLSGLPTDLEPDFDDEAKDWASISAGTWLASQLQELRQASGKGLLPGRVLKATLRPYQQAGVKWLGTLTQLGLGACLADDMGLGKTIQILALLLNRKRRKWSQGASLLVLPASLIGNWLAEAERFAPSLTFKVLHSSSTTKAERDAARADPKSFLKGVGVLATTYGMVLRESWLGDQEWDLLILDEAQAIKNPGAKQTRAIKKLSACARVALTGTPVENRLGDLWSLFDFLCPGLLSSSKIFQKQVRVMRDSSTGFRPLRRLVQPYLLRRLKTDKSVIEDLPEKIEMVARCPLSKVQAVHYKKAVSDLKQALKTVSSQDRRGLVLSYLMRFKQICNHPSQWLGAADYEESQSGKFTRLRELCEEIGERQEKVLVFTQYRSLCKPLSEFLKSLFGVTGYVLHGGTKVKDRSAMVSAFQDPKGAPFFVLSLKAGGTGLNLTQANHVIHFDRWWNPAVEQQATDRAFRIGQRRSVLVHKFVTEGTIEERIDAMIADKRELAESMFEGAEPVALTELGDDEIMGLVSLDLNSVGR